MEIGGRSRPGRKPRAAPGARGHAACFREGRPQPIRPARYRQGLGRRAGAPARRRRRPISPCRARSSTCWPMWDRGRTTVGGDADHVAPLLAAALADGSAEARAPEAVLKATAFMRRAYARPITCEDAARAAGISTAHLHALFKQWLGVSPAARLSGIRLERARERLAGQRRADRRDRARCRLQRAERLHPRLPPALRRSPAAYRRRLEIGHKAQ